MLQSWKLIYISEHDKAETLYIIDTEVLKEFLNVLEVFQEATLMTEADKTPTLNMALPLLLSLIQFLQSQIGHTKHCGNFISGLLLSISKRFNGLLQLIFFLRCVVLRFIHKTMMMVPGMMKYFWSLLVLILPSN